MAELCNAPYYTRSAVLFLIFNRPDTTRKVFEEIRKAKPPRLYVAADGPRTGRNAEIRLCSDARMIALQVDWDCELITNFRPENAGCREGVSSAINWFFEHEEEGIILEDDCVPANSFFSFCDTLLEKYRNDTRIRHITGCNLQQGQKWGEGAYYFSRMTHVWGWASWKNRWIDYDKNLSRFDMEDMTTRLAQIFDDEAIVESYGKIFDNVKAGKINAWGYQLDFTNFFYDGLTAIPNENLISNIGFRADATHTIDADNIYANIPTTELGEMIHPAAIRAERPAERVILDQIFKAEPVDRRNRRWVEMIRKKTRAVLKMAASFMV